MPCFRHGPNERALNVMLAQEASSRLRESECWNFVNAFTMYFLYWIFKPLDRLLFLNTTFQRQSSCRNVVFLIKYRTMNDVQNCDSHINILSSQTYTSYFEILVSIFLTAGTLSLMAGVKRTINFVPQWGREGVKVRNEDWRNKGMEEYIRRKEGSENKRTNIYINKVIRRKKRKIWQHKNEEIVIGNKNK
jgi:hypothetical protein